MGQSWSRPQPLHLAGGQIVKLENLTDEFALLTGEMSEAAYADCAAAFEKTAKIRQRIRAEF